MSNEKTLGRIAQDAGLRTYQVNYGIGREHAAEYALEGRSHYYDASTRRGFGSRVSKITTHGDDTILATCESVLHPTYGRVHRFVVFDVSGRVVQRFPEFDDAQWRTSRKAQKAMCAWLDACDPAQILRDCIGNQINQHTNALEDLQSAMKQLQGG
jgi:hypothetical protein